MTTMKDGPGSDPFADDDPEEDTEESGSASTENEPPTADEAGEATAEVTHQYPYVLRRDTVKDERSEIVAYLRDEYQDGEDDLLGDVAEEMDLSSGDVSKFDLREALWELGQRHPEEVAEILLEWGYDAKQ